MVLINQDIVDFIPVLSIRAIHLFPDFFLNSLFPIQHVSELLKQSSDQSDLPKFSIYLFISARICWSYLTSCPSWWCYADIGFIFVVLVYLFNGIPTLSGYLMPKLDSFLLFSFICLTAYQLFMGYLMPKLDYFLLFWFICLMACQHFRGYLMPKLDSFLLFWFICLTKLQVTIMRFLCKCLIVISMRLKKRHFISPSLTLSFIR